MPYSNHLFAKLLKEECSSQVLHSEEVVNFLASFFTSSPKNRKLFHLVKEAVRRRPAQRVELGAANPEAHALKCIQLVTELRVPRSRFRLVPKFLKKFSCEYEELTGSRLPRFFPPRSVLTDTWKSLVHDFKLSEPVLLPHLGVWGICWPLPAWAEYVSGYSALTSTIDWTPGQLTLVVKGDAYPVGGDSWSQLNVSLLNHGLRARTLSHNWVVALAFVGDKDPDVLHHLWKENITVCFVFMF